MMMHREQEREPNGQPHLTASTFLVPVKGGFSVHISPPSVHTFSAPRVVAPAPRISVSPPVTRTITVMPPRPSPPVTVPRPAPVQQTIVVHHDYTPSYYHPAWYYPIWMHPWSQPQQVVVQQPGGCYDSSCGYYPPQSHWMAYTAMILAVLILLGFVFARMR